jgi:HEAT repeat protein
VSLPESEIFELKLRAELEPDNLPVLLELGAACERAGLDEDAQRAFARALALDPGHPLARRGRLDYFLRRYGETAAKGDAYARAAIVHQVSELRDRYAVPWLLSLLDGAEPAVCQKAAEALGKLGDRAAVPALIRVLRSDAACAWWQAAEALGAIGDRATVPPLVATLAEGSSNARCAAAHALGLLGDPAAAAGLAEALARGDPPLRRAVAGALGRLKAPRAAPALAAALDDPDPQTREAAAASLGELAGESFHPSPFASAHRQARRWWEKSGRFRQWDEPAAKEPSP